MDVDTGEYLWVCPINSGNNTECLPVLADGKIFLIEYVEWADDYSKFCVLCIDARYGTRVWETADSYFDNAEACLYYQDGKVYLLNGDIDEGNGSLYCLNASNGSLVWETPLWGYPWESMAIDGNNIFISTNSGWNSWWEEGEEIWSMFYCIDASTGGVRWQKENLGDHLRDAPLAMNGRVYIKVGGPESYYEDHSDVYEHIFCLSQGNGSLIWDYELEDSLNASSELSSNGDSIFLSYLASQGANRLISIDVQDGALNWSTPLLTSDIYQVSLSNSVVYIVLGSRYQSGLRYATSINGYDIGSGQFLFSIPTNEEYQYQPLTLADGKLFYTTLGAIYCYG